MTLFVIRPAQWLSVRTMFALRCPLAVALLSFLSSAAANLCACGGRAAGEQGLRVAGDDGTVWVASWGASPQSFDADGPPFQLRDETLRQIVHVSLGGSRVRVRLSNLYGGQSVQVGSAHVALRARDGGIVPGSDRTLSFDGSPDVLLAPGMERVSDAAGLDVKALADLAVTLYFPEPVRLTSGHAMAAQTSYVASGDATGVELIPRTRPGRSWALVSGVDVTSNRGAASVVALGDSLTDGYQSSPDANRRWTDGLARRLETEHPEWHRGVVNEGIAGNRLVGELVGQSALGRFDRDVLQQSGVRYLVLLEGLNDIGEPGPGETVGADRIISGQRELVRRAHARGVKVAGGTILPFEGMGDGFYTAAGEATRQAVNQWVRTGGELDAVIDFDRALRDPGSPGRLSPAFDSGDHGHPNDAGYQAMADAVDLSIFAPAHD